MGYAQLQSTFNPTVSRKLNQLLYEDPESIGEDIRGFLVMDRHHKKVGIVSEVYCDEKTLRPRYIEIVSMDDDTDKSLLYPYEYARWHKEDGPAFIPSPRKAVLQGEEYDFNHVMETDGADLITFSEALERSLDGPCISFGDEDFRSFKE